MNPPYAVTVTRSGEGVVAPSVAGAARAPSPPDPPHGAAPSAAAREARPTGATLITTDASCDLPDGWLAQRGIVVLPLRVRNVRGSRTDGRRGAADGDRRREFFSHDLIAAEDAGEALPLSSVGIVDCVEERLGNADCVIVIVRSSRPDGAYGNALAAAHELMLRRGRQQAAGDPANALQVLVVEAATALNGHGVLVSECWRLLDHGAPAPRVVARLDHLRQQVQTIIAPGDTTYFRRRGELAVERGAPWFALGLGRVFERTPLLLVHRGDRRLLGQLSDHDAAIERAVACTCERIEHGLASPVVCLSFAGDVAAIREWPPISVLAATCRRHDVELQVAEMSMANALAVGRGAVALSFATAR
ncbi:MAG: DegV family protein [Burkholderiales bacterium]|nr:DegV family protein [Burkholderiales bacterium]